ncbi:hypothetical protein [Draconibacterium sp.]
MKKTQYEKEPQKPMFFIYKLNINDGKPCMAGYGVLWRFNVQ